MYFLEHYNENPEFLNNYLKYYYIIEFSAKTSVDEVYFDLRSFFRYITLIKNNENIYDLEKIQNTKIDNITLDDMNNVKANTIDDFIFYLRNTLDNSPKTRNRKLSSLRKFFKYLSDNNLIDYNPTLNTRYATVEKRNPKYLTLNESKKMLSQTIKNEFKHKTRNYAMTCLFLNCGMRLSELVQINLTDIKFDEMTLRLQGKGNKERVIYLNEACTSALSEYLKIRPNEGVPADHKNALFISRNKRRISRRAVQDIVYNYLEKTGLGDQGLSVHKLRHTAATLMYQHGGVDVRVLQNVLGHENLGTTQIYTHVADEQVKHAIDSNPLSSVNKKK